VVELGYVRLGQVRWGYYDAVIFLVRSGGVRLDTVGQGLVGQGRVRSKAWRGKVGPDAAWPDKTRQG